MECGCLQRLEHLLARVVEHEMGFDLADFPAGGDGVEQEVAQALAESSRVPLEGNELWGNVRKHPAVHEALERSETPLPPPLAALDARERAFRIAPSVLAVEKASRRVNVVEVNARDRGGLLARMAHALFAHGAEIRSAHIATYGERAVDVFYLSEADGARLSEERLEAVRQALLDAATGD